jgi:hypothetical protein
MIIGMIKAHPTKIGCQATRVPSGKAVSGRGRPPGHHVDPTAAGHGRRSRPWPLLVETTRSASRAA